MEKVYLTIVGFNHYCGKEPFQLGHLIRCKKEPKNPVDQEAIQCTLPMLGTVGYVANSPYTVAGGTRSAGRLYDQVPERFYVRVCFTTQSKIICCLEPWTAGEMARLSLELSRQMSKDDDWDEEDDQKEDGQSMGQCDEEIPF